MPLVSVGLQGCPSLEPAWKAGGACLARKGSYAFQLQKFTEQRKMLKVC